MSNEVFIVSGCRTPIGTLEGCLSNLSAVHLGTVVIKEALKRGNVDSNMVDEVIMGQVLTGGQGQNPARQSAVAAGVPFDVPAYTVNMLCGSGLKVTYLAYQSIKNGDSQVIVCGGQESMSRAVHLAYLRKTTKLGQIDLKDSILLDGLTDAFVNMHMGSTVENLADKYQVSRREQDEFALLSQMKVKEAVDNGYFKNEIVPVSLPKSTVQVIADEFPKPNTTIEALASLKPIFKTNGGTVTAGNASGINDGAAAVILSSKSAIEKYNLKPMARIVGFSQSGIEPIDMGIGPVKAITKLLEKISWTIDDVDLFEINEAFAVQSILVIQMLGLDKSKVNIAGGAIALGHPIGASGTRILVTLLHNLERTKKKKGIASLCVGGGMGIAIAVEMCS